MDNATFWGYQRGSYGLVEEFYHIGNLLGLVIVWNDTLVAIMIQGHTNYPSLLYSKLPRFVIGCLFVNND